MTRHEILRIAVQHARQNGFDFRRWFQSAIPAKWTSLDNALDLLMQRQTYYVLLFSHEFAAAFWKAGSQITILIPAISYTVRDKEGELVKIHRKAYARRTLKADSWRYHLREMVDFPQPLLYLRRFIVSREDLQRAEREREAARLARHPGTVRAEALGTAAGRRRSAPR